MVLDKPIIGGAVAAVDVPSWIGTGAFTATASGATNGTILSVDSTTQTWRYQLDTGPSLGEEFTETITFMFTPTGGGTDFTGMIEVKSGAMLMGFIMILAMV